MLKPILVVILALISPNLIAAGGHVKDRPMFDESGKIIKPHKTFKKGAWELQIVYLLKGTRSEGLHGVLIKQGEVVKPHSLGEEIQTDLGPMKYYGDFKKRETNWAISGWCYSDQDKIPRPSAKWGY